ncbi:unnamed protein product [Pleuronectes platessa]|uniref:Uncharacterized protein n=1 Tax=Pleuronectes platessa TaxID=8262 RepID=A0A9N7V5D5_PLEPL|nr:unnamed protein product [Pleuronectes platessa]
MDSYPSVGEQEGGMKRERRAEGARHSLKPRTPEGTGIQQMINSNWQDLFCAFYQRIISWVSQPHATTLPLVEPGHQWTQELGQVVVLGHNSCFALIKTPLIRTHEFGPSSCVHWCPGSIHASVVAWGWLIPSNREEERKQCGQPVAPLAPNAILTSERALNREKAGEPGPGPEERIRYYPTCSSPSGPL